MVQDNEKLDSVYIIINYLQKKNTFLFVSWENDTAEAVTNIVNKNHYKKDEN